MIDLNCMSVASCRVQNGIVMSPIEEGHTRATRFFFFNVDWHLPSPREAKFLFEQKKNNETKWGVEHMAWESCTLNVTTKLPRIIGSDLDLNYTKKIDHKLDNILASIV